MLIELNLPDLYEFLNSNDVIEPIIVSRNGEKHAVVVSYEAFVANQRANRQVLTMDNLSAEDLKALLDAEVTDERTLTDEFNVDTQDWDKP